MQHDYTLLPIDSKVRLLPYVSLLNKETRDKNGIVRKLQMVFCGKL